MKASALLGLFFVAAGFLPAEEQRFAKVSAERLDLGPEGEGWNGAQFVQADRKGRVSLLRADTLEVFPVDSHGRLGKATVLKPAAPVTEADPMTLAAMAPAGDDWLLGSQETSPRWFPGGREKSLSEIPQWPSGLGFQGSSPVVAVLPLGRMNAQERPRLPGENPLLFEWSAGKWSVRSRFDYQPPEADSFSRSKRSTWLRVLGERKLAGRGDGKLWVAHTHAYRLELQSPTAKVLVALQLGPEHGRVRAHTDAEREQIAAALEKNGLGNLAKRDLGVRAVSVIVGLAAGRDERAYLVVQDGGTTYLDRFDPLAGSLERVEIVGLESTNFTLAAGSDALYIAPFDPDVGRWRIPWEVLEAAKWKEVEGARVEGAIPPVDPP